MKAFLIILIVACLAFGDSCLAISRANSSDNSFVSSLPDAFVYTYRMILGDFDTDDFGAISLWLVYLLFLLCTLFNMIIMLNLLIAIISETFANVNANSEPNSYKEMASLISENGYMIPEDVRRSYAKQNNYLYVCTPLETKGVTESNPIEDMAENGKEQFTLMEKKNDEVMDKLEEIKKRNQIDVFNLFNDIDGIVGILEESTTQKVKRQPRKKYVKDEDEDEQEAKPD